MSYLSVIFSNAEFIMHALIFRWYWFRDKQRSLKFVIIVHTFYERVQKTLSVQIVLNGEAISDWLYCLLKRVNTRLLDFHFVFTFSIQGILSVLIILHSLH